MSTALVVGAVLLVALACPAMMWWRSRHGGSTCCAPAAPEQPRTGDLAELRRRHERVAARIAELEEEPTGARARSSEAQLAG